MSKILSIVIPSYNRRAYIAECVMSCLAVKSPGWSIQVVVVDDGSSDGTFEYLTEFFSLQISEGKRGYSGPLRVIRVANGERGAARNAGARVAIQELNSEWLLFLDADDVLVSDAFAKALQEIQNSTRIFSTKFLLWNGKQTWGEPQPPTPRGFFSADLFLNGNPLALGTTLIHREVFEAVHGFSSDREMSGSEDWAFLFQVSALGSVQYSSEISVWYRRHEGNTSPQRTERAMATALESLQPFLRDHFGGLYPRALREIEMYHALMVIGAYNSAGLAKNAFSLLVKYIQNYPGTLWQWRTWYVAASVLTKMFAS